MSLPIDSSSSAEQSILFRGTHSFPMRASDPEVFIGRNYAALQSVSALPLDMPGAVEIELSNEFQLIRPDRIVDLRQEGEDRSRPDLSAFSSSIGREGGVSLESVSVYNITGITPLVIDNNDVVTVYFQSSNPQSNDWIGESLRRRHPSMYSNPPHPIIIITINITIIIILSSTLSSS